MPQIGNTVLYPKQTPSINDFLIGTDGDVTNKTTRNYLIKDLVTLFLENSDIEGITQNNKVVQKELGQIDVNVEGLTVADAVNALPQFEVTETENYVFTCSKNEYSEPVNTGGTTSNPVLHLFLYTYLFKPGKGFYGIESTEATTELDMSHFTEINKEEVILISSTSQQPVLYTIPNVSGLSAVAAINASGTYAILDGKDAYFKVNNIGGTIASTVYRFIGTEGSYGVGATQVVTGNLLTLEELGIQTTSTTNIRFIETIPLLVPSGSSKSAVVNALPTFTVTQNDIYIINVIETVTSSTTTNVYMQAASYFLKRGKGVYGVGNPTSPIRETDFKLNFKEKTQTTNSPKEVTYYTLDASTEEDIIDAINNSATAIVKNSVNTTVVEKDGVRYDFIGANGSYGFGLLQADSGDIEELEESNIEIDDAFAKPVTISDVLVLPPRTLPSSPASGTICNVANTVLFHNGTSWYTLDMTPYGI